MPMTAKLFVDDNKGIIYSETAILLENKDFSKLRKVEDTVDNFAKEELRLSLKIAKKNVEIDPRNKYYLDQLEKVHKQWSELNA